MGRDTYKGVDVNYGLGLITDLDAGLPALHWAINSAASDMADFALEILSGGNPKPQVFVRAHNTWEPIFHLGKSAELNIITAYLLSHSEMGMHLNMKLEMEEERYILKANRSIFSLILSRWEECPIHRTGQSYSIEEISRRT
jgi:hypothetical protein